MERSQQEAMENFYTKIGEMFYYKCKFENRTDKFSKLIQVMVDLRSGWFFFLFARESLRLKLAY